MRSPLIRVAVLAAAIAASSCSGDDGGSTPTNPGATNPAPGAVTVSIVGTTGNGSYVPNPVQKAAGELLMFKNNDPLLTHHIVMDDGSVDFGNLSPGTSSQARAVGSGNFHCTTHPSMVGSVNGQTAPEPPPGSGDGY